MVPQPTRDPLKEHFRHINPFCIVRDISRGIWIYPPYHMYHDDFRAFIHQLGGQWNADMRRWEIAPNSQQQEIVKQIIEFAFVLCHWDVQTDAHTTGFESQWISINQGEMSYATQDSLWYEHPEGYYVRR